MASKDEILTNILNELNIPEIERVLNSSHFNAITNVHDGILLYHTLPEIIIKGTRNGGRNMRSYHLAYFMHHGEAIKKAYLSFYLILMGHRSISFSVDRILLELMIKGSFWDCISRKRYRNKKIPSGDKLKKIRYAIQKMIDDYSGTFTSCQYCSLSAIDSVLDYIDLNISEKSTWENIVPRMNDMIKILYDWKKFRPLKEPEVIYTIYKILSNDIHSHPNSIIDELHMQNIKVNYCDAHLQDLSDPLSRLMQILDIGNILTLNIFFSDRYLENEIFKFLPDIKNSFEQFNFPYSNKRISNILSQYQKRINLI